ncbi:GTPase IMAP family member 7-like [Myxocyprinus asiaticus]|uniref:GTPase IMAP family member 7-like n=1 Tax=Myxocyprinus asiaticus TaxID=70543 RepID=UPI0022229ECB|nr:GTPase IMAP family member 7-like [Myxocyprinus asiaticus]
MARYRGHDEEKNPLLNDSGTFQHEARQSKESIKKFRFMVLGSDNTLMNEACGIILGLTQRGVTSNIGACILKDGQVSGRQVSVLKTPSYWLEHLKSHLFFRSGVKSMKNDMQFCDSMVFPGPHAFLLVLRDPQNSRKEHYLLRALSQVFGKEAIDYCMVLFMREHRERDIERNQCVKNCRQRYHVLKNTEESILNLLGDIETMIQQRKNAYFTNDFELLEKAKTHFQMEFDAEYADRESMLRRELENTVEDLKKEITELEKCNRLKVRELKDELNKELDASRDRENRLRHELDASRDRENRLRHELDASRDRENQLKLDFKKLQREIQQLKATEKELENNLREAKDKEALLLTKLQLECSIIQQEEELQAKEKELHARQRDLEKRKMELEAHKRDTRSSGSQQHEHQSSTAVTPADEGEADREDSQASGSDEFEGLKAVRRNSKQLEPPKMSESEHRPLHTL